MARGRDCPIHRSYGTIPTGTSKAVNELVGLGLIEIKQNGNQAVRVTEYY